MLKVINTASASQYTLRSALELHLQTKTRDDECSTPRLYRSRLEQRLPDWLDLPMDSITEEMVLDRHEQLVKESSLETADFVLRVFNAVANHVAQLDETYINPANILGEEDLWLKKKKPTTARCLSHVEVGTCWLAVQSLNKNTRDYLVFILLTGVNSEEAGLLTWSQIDLASALVHVKSRPHRVPLSNYTLAMLATRRAHGSSHHLVFHTHHSNEIKPIRRKAYGAKQISDITGFDVSLVDLHATFHGLSEQVSTVMHLRDKDRITQAVTDLVLNLAADAARLTK